MITKEQALNLYVGQELHVETCKVIIGPRGGKRLIQERVRVNGKTQIWKTRPNDFRIPFKYGLYGYGEITAINAEQFHLASECNPITSSYQ